MGLIFNELFRAKNIIQVDLSIGVLKELFACFKHAVKNNHAGVNPENFKTLFAGVDKLLFVRRLSMFSHHIQVLYEIDRLKSEGVFSRGPIRMRLADIRKSEPKALGDADRRWLEADEVHKCDDTFLLPEHFVEYYLESLKSLRPELCDLRMNELKRLLRVVSKRDCENVFEKMNFGFVNWEDRRRRQFRPKIYDLPRKVRPERPDSGRPDLPKRPRESHWSDDPSKLKANGRSSGAAKSKCRCKSITCSRRYRPIWRKWCANMRTRSSKWTTFCTAFGMWTCPRPTIKNT